MFDTSLIREQIAAYIEKGITDFVIFPFGENGELTRAVLEYSFGIIPVAIVDNSLYRTIEGIISFSDFEKAYKPGWHIIYTMESEGHHDSLKDNIKRVVPEDSIIDLLEYRKTHYIEYYSKVKNRLCLDSLLPIDRKVIDVKNKCKIRTRIVHSRTQTWNTISSICEAIQDDEDMDLLIIIGWDRREECEQQARKHGYKYVWWKDYDAEEDEPDVLILSQPYDVVTQLPGIRDKAKLIIVANTLLVRNTQGLSRFYEVQREGFARFAPDYFLCDSLLYQDIKDSYCLNAELVEMGNAKFDGIYKACMEKRYLADMKKAEGKKTILWATDHGIYDNTIMHTTFDLYVSCIMRYFSEYDDLCLIIRLHRELFNEIVNAGYWSKDDCNRFIEYCDNTDNVIFDTSETYDSVYSISDAIIADICCGIMVSALPTLKPICVTARSNYEKPFHPELTDYFYKARSEDELLEFLELMRRGEDPMKEERRHVAQKYIKGFDGRNGYRIKEFIKSKFRERQFEDIK